jgi:hypothetical protein
MKILATVFGAVTAAALLSGCAYDGSNHYGWGYGYGPRYDRYGYGYGYGYGRRYDRYTYGYGPYGESYWNARGCWLDTSGIPHCVR